MAQYGKTIKLFLVEGSVEGIVIADLSNWNGKTIKIPRSSVKKCERNELNVSGVYFLFSETEEGKQAVYIGEANNIKNRLLQHIESYNKDEENFYWHTAVLFSGDELDRTRTRYLENELVSIAKDVGTFEILTKNTYKNEIVSEAIKAEMDEFIDNIKIMINTLGFNVLEQAGAFTKEISGVSNNDVKVEKLYCKNRDGSILAEGFVDASGFVVLKGSHVCSIKKSFEDGQPGYFKLRKKLEEEKIIDNNVFTKDWLFTAPSAAAAIIFGRGTNGKKSWKTEAGFSLEDLDI